MNYFVHFKLPKETSDFSAGPFITKEEAERRLDILKSWHKHTYPDKEIKYEITEHKKEE